jgi:Holliday junction resolvase-like predicted endonuclease
MEESIESKAISAIEKFLKLKGLTIVESNWGNEKEKTDLVAADGDELAFIDCNVCANEGTGFEDENIDRERFERIATQYLVEHEDITESSVRFDILSMLVIGNKKGFIRYHKDVLNSSK